MHAKLINPCQPAQARMAQCFMPVVIFFVFYVKDHPVAQLVEFVAKG